MSHVHHPSALRATGLRAVVLALALALAATAAVVVLLLVIGSSGGSSAPASSRAGQWPDEAGIANALDSVRSAGVYRSRPDEGLAAVPGVNPR